MGGKKKTVKLEVELNEDELETLKLIAKDGDDGYEPDSSTMTVEDYNEEQERLHRLCELGLVSSILGEQFYITPIGNKFLK
jgi:hypothetical protein